MATTTGLTVKEFLAQVPEDQRCELIRGEIVPMANAKFRHEKVKSNANRIFMAYLLGNPIGEVYFETMYQVTEIDGLQPDLSILLNDQIPAQAPDEVLDLAPALVFEVVSSESAAKMEERIEVFLQREPGPCWLPLRPLRASASSSPRDTAGSFEATKGWN